MIDAIKYTSLFLFLVLLQGLVLNNILFWGYLNPYIYLLFILLLPVNTDKALLLFVSFALGACIDMFENSGGIHAAACTFTAFVRPLILRILSRRQGAELTDFKLREFSFSALSFYSLILIFLHHFILFSLEAFRLAEIALILLRTVYSSLATFILVMIIQLWNYRKTNV